MLISKAANDYAQKLVYNKYINEDEREVCAYGLEITISTLLSILLTLVISLFLGRTLEGIVYLLFYCTLRTYAGGYHANSHGSCILTFLSCYLMVNIMIFSNLINWKLTILILLFCNIIILVLKPVDAINNKFSNYTKNKLHIRAIIIMLVHSIIILGFIRNSETLYIGIYAALGDCVCSLLVLIGRIQKKFYIKGERNEY